MFKMIVVDLDGTILNNEKKLSKDTKKYLKMLKKKGYIIVIATGRIYRSALKITHGAKFANYIITDTGTCIYSVSHKKAIMKQTIPQTTIQKFFAYYDEKCRYIDICSKNKIYKYSKEKENNSIVKTMMEKKYILKKCPNASHISIAMKTNEDVIALYNKMLKEIPELDILVMQDSFSQRKWLETMPKGVSKYSSIKILADSLKIANEEIIAFGDGLNDIEMLEKCGYGVALLNSLEEVKRRADDITKFDYNHDGVIKYLKEHLYDNKKIR